MFEYDVDMKTKQCANENYDKISEWTRLRREKKTK
jgi:hypothetical protein